MKPGACKLWVNWIRERVQSHLRASRHAPRVDAHAEVGGDGGGDALQRRFMKRRGARLARYDGGGHGVAAQVAFKSILL